MPKKCSKCGLQHAPPTGRKCQWEDGNHLLGDQDLAQTVNDLKSDMISIKSTLEKLVQVPPGSGATKKTPAPKDKDTEEELAAKVKDRMSSLHLIQDSDSDSDSEVTCKKDTKKKGKKSGRARTADDLILKDVDWPHFYVYRGANRQAANMRSCQSRNLHLDTWRVSQPKGWTPIHTSRC